jgi:hypothetical protein
MTERKRRKYLWTPVSKRRPHAGRPTNSEKGIQSRTITTSFRLSPDEYDRLQAHLVRTDMTLAGLVRILTIGQLPKGAPEYEVVTS